MHRKKFSKRHVHDLITFGLLIAFVAVILSFAVTDRSEQGVAHYQSPPASVRSL